MDSTSIKIGYAVRSRNDEGNMVTGKHTAGTQARSRLDVYAKIGDDVELVYSNIDRLRLKTHSLLAARMLSMAAAQGQVPQALSLSVNPAEVTKNGLRYVLHAINNTDTDTKMRFHQSKSVALDCQIWGAVMALELAAPQGQFRHKLLDRIGNIVPDAETLTMCHMVHQTGKPIYQRLVTRAAECLTDGTIDTIDTIAGQHLLNEIVAIPRLRQDVGKCVRKNKERLAELEAARKHEDRHREAVWTLENGLRPISEREIERVKKGGRRS